jgi:DNA-binding PucR family transcriptional regulator
VHVRDHVPELLLARSPRLAAALHDRYLAPLAAPRHAELRRTLEVLVCCRLDRGRTCALLHVHRNTLAYRLARIEELLGIDLSSPRDLTCLVLALGAPAFSAVGAR